MRPVRGFTLIELLVVIAIIGVLSSVILGSLSTARGKARDAAIKSDVRQFATLMELEYDSSSSYAALQAGWVATASGCNSSFSGTYASNARRICEHIVTTGANIHTGTSSNNATAFSIMAWLPGKGVYYCLGSSGSTSETAAGVWTPAGCYANP